MSNKLPKKKNNGEERKLSFQFKVTKITDTTGKTMKCREVTWTDLAILHGIGAIKCPAFLSYIRDQDDIFWAMFSDAFDRDGNKDLYTVKLGDYNNIAGSYIKHDSQETAALWERLTPSKDVEIK